MKLFLLSFLLSILIIAIYMIISKYTTKNKEKLTPFECGFDTFSLSRIPFSIRFFKITLIFLIFDIEIIMIIPTPLSITSSQNFTMSFTILMLIIITGLLYEWKVGSLNWIT